MATIRSSSAALWVASWVSRISLRGARACAGKKETQAAQPKSGWTSLGWGRGSTAGDTHGYQLNGAGQPLCNNPPRYNTPCYSPERARRGVPVRNTVSGPYSSRLTLHHTPHPSPLQPSPLQPSPERARRDMPVGSLVPMAHCLTLHHTPQPSPPQPSPPQPSLLQT